MITIGLYVALLLALTGPLGVVCGGAPLCLSQMAELFTRWWYWAILGILGLAQALLLVVPVKAARPREVKRRHILVPVVTASILALLLLLGGMASVLAAIFGDAFYGGAYSFPESKWPAMTAALVVGALWLLWILLFRGYARLQENPKTIVDKITTSLLKGSILELLVAVSCHIVVRNRGDCSAPAGTFLGIAAGVAVMLMAFGPGVFWLFVRRRQRITAKVSAV
jgi:hypothetical protein